MEAEKIANWITERVDKAQAKGIVMGLSGGIDSAVLCALCCQAVKPENVLALIMPCQSHSQDEEHAHLVAESTHCKVRKISLDYLFNVMDTILVDATRPANGRRKIAQANLKARLRMVTQYYIANSLNYLVAGSDDKSENYVGYFTKYGDGASDFAPLGNLTKTEVRKLAAELGIPSAIIEKPSSPGLWSGQTAEGELGINYQDLDRFLSGESCDLVVRSKIEWRHGSTEHKRQLPYVPEF